MKEFTRQREALPRVMVRSDGARWWGLLAIAMLGPVSTISAGSYRISSYSIDGGGGGVSTGSRFRIEGTVNQPSAGMPMAGLTYQVDGGFWAVPEEDEVVVDPSTPVLSIKSIDPGKISITWDAGTGRRWQLERSLGLSPAAWKAVPGAIQAPVLLPSSDTTTLFRLRQVE